MVAHTTPLTSTMAHPEGTRARPAATVVDTSRSPHARLRAVPLTAVRLRDDFWQPRRAINRSVTLPAQYEHCEATGRIDNFRRASGKKDLPFQGIFFNDSDVYKWLEAAAWTLAAEPDQALAAMVDTVIAEIAGAQQPDGYLNTYFMFDKAAERWTNLKDMHELYCAGHLIQAAVAHYRSTGGEQLLDVARHLADHICATFGPPESGRREGTCGHEEIEMALVELSRATGEPRYLAQAQYFVDARGKGLIGGSPYHQDHAPVRELDRMTGHAVRAVYLTAGIADIYAETGESALRTALHRLWDNMVTRQMYVTGGIGSRYEGEAFGRDWELPNERAYTESCAGIGSLMWNWRMLALEGQAVYADLIEMTLYNGILAGLSLDGQHYFYQNPLADDGTHRRQPWFGCACCPPNIARLLASLPGYLYSVAGDSIFVHLYAASDAEITLPDERVVALQQRSRYPWDGSINLDVQSAGTYALHLRVPAWCTEGARLLVNGTPIEPAPEPGTYVELRRDWQPGDTVRLDLPMAVHRIVSHPYVAENSGAVALTRGPLVYCVETADNAGIDPRDLVLPQGTEFMPSFEPDLLGGIVALRFRAMVAKPHADWTGKLYCQAPEVTTTNAHQAEVVAIPYYAWANREPGPMRVWLRAQ